MKDGTVPSGPFRVIHCQHSISKNFEGVERLHVDVVRKGRSAWFRGVQTCGNPWHCPICAERISMRRRRELQEMERSAFERGAGVALVTLTFPHGLGDDLCELLDRLGEARRYMYAGRRWGEFKRRWGWIGEARTLEITHGDNGFHPHTHSMAFTQDAPTDDDQRAQFQAEYYELWRQGCRRAGLPEPHPRWGCNVRWASREGLHDYISKWGMAGEVAGACAKEYGSTGRSMWQVLDGAAHSDRDAWLWRQYMTATDRRRQLFVSPKLRERLELQPELTDLEAAERAQESDEDPVVVVARIPAQDWYMICLAGAHSQVLEAALEHPEALDGLLDDLRRRYKPPEPEVGPVANLWGVQ